MSNESNKYLDKIVALLAKAESTDNHHEAKALSAKAQELMSKWEIHEAEVEARLRDQGRTQTGDKLVDEHIWIPGVMERAYKIQMWFQIATLNDVRVVQMTTKLGGRFYADGRRDQHGRAKVEKGVYLHLMGFEHNLTMVKMLVSSLMIQSLREYKSDDVQDMGRLQCTALGHWIKWKNSFMLGYISGVVSKLKKAKREATVEADVDTSTALVLADRRDAVDKYVDAMHPRLGKGSGTTAGGNSLATGMGWRAGQRADTGAGHVGKGRPQL